MRPTAGAIQRTAAAQALEQIDPEWNHSGS